MTGIILSSLYCVVSAILFANTLCHARLFLAARRSRALSPPSTPARWPRVTVQLPLYNERYVVRRLLEHVAALDYPRHLLDVQILDDSTDDTTHILSAEVARHRANGLRIAHLHRPTRDGYKAGALQHGLESGTGELILVLDADFMPRPSLLRELVPHFDDARVAMVQARWTHANRSESWLTRLQGSFLDFHFAVEQVGRSRLDCFVNFNGTAGIWRAAAIVDAGGWCGETLTEDLDLSYRAQLRGWTFIIRLDVSAAAELPADVRAFRQQQHRWMKGVAQNAKRLLPCVWRAPLARRAKVHAIVQLIESMMFIVLLALVVLTPLLVLGVAEGICSPWTLVNPFLVGNVVLAPVYFAPQISTDAGGRGQRFIDWLFFLTVSTGLSLHNSAAVLAGLLGRRSEFVRTPKAGDGPGIARSNYRVKTLERIVIGEVLLWLYLSTSLAYAAIHGLWYLMSFPALGLCGLSAMAYLAAQSRRLERVCGRQGLLPSP